MSPLRQIQEVFETYCKNDYLQRDLPKSHYGEDFGQGTKFQTLNSLDIPKLLK